MGEGEIVGSNYRRFGCEFDDREARRFEFIKLDYERGLEVIHQLHAHRLAYQKFYIALVGSVITASVLILRFVPQDSDRLFGAIGEVITVQNLIGSLFLGAAIVGYIVVRNLAGVRVQEVFINNLILRLRQDYIGHLGLGRDYPNLQSTKPVDWRSGDYLTIWTCFIANVFLLNLAVLSWVGDGTSGGLVTASLLVSIFYFFVHLASVEAVLRRGYWKQGEGR
jgi:hypothetical protein